MDALLAALLGLALGGLSGLVLLFWQRGRWQARIAELEIRLQQERDSAGEKAALLRHAERELSDAFKALSADALKSNNQAFLELARQNLAAYQEHAKGDLAARQQAVATLVKPLTETLDKLNLQHREIELQRSGAYASLTEQVKGLLAAQHDLKGETHRLVTALRRPEVRGRWGEVQLRRVVELAGMLDHCDFDEQEATIDGRRPDMVVRLPGGKNLVLDAKAPLAAYLEAVEGEDEAARSRALARYAQHVRTHVQQLAAKAYWEQFAPAPEFVVLFLPGEAFFAAALREVPDLIEYAGEKKVILATPTTLLALLKAVYYGWRQEVLADNARQVGQLGAQLYERLSKLGEHWNSVGKNLGLAVKAYNDATGSLESRVLVSARKFEDFKVAPEGRNLPPALQVEQTTRSLAAPEFTEVSTQVSTQVSET